MKLFGHSLKLSQKLGLNLYFIDRLKKNYQPYLNQYFDSKYYNYISPDNSAITYKFFNEENLLIFNHSSLGYEYMSRGFKCVCFGHNSKFLFHGDKNNYKEEGLFWTSKIDYKSFEKKILDILKYKTRKWKRDITKFSLEIMMYDKSNKIKKKIINNILKKKVK